MKGKTCKKTAGCVFDQPSKTCSNADGSGSVCDGLKRRACKKVDGCAFSAVTITTSNGKNRRVKQCAVFDPCAGRRKKSCLAEGCEFNAASKVCSLPTTTTTTPPPTTTTEHPDPCFKLPSKECRADDACVFDSGASTCATKPTAATAAAAVPTVCHGRYTGPIDGARGK